MGAADSVGDVVGFSGNGVYIQCGQGVIEVMHMQKPGGKKIDAKTCLQSIGVGQKQLHFFFFF